MERLHNADLRRVMDFLHVAYGIEDAAEFHERLLRALHVLIPSDSVSITEVNTRTRHVSGMVVPDVAMDRSRFVQHVGEHPIITYHERHDDQRTLKISDFLTQRQFHRLGLYRDYYRSVDVEYQLAATLPAPEGWVIGLVLNRKLRDFSERDRLTLNLLRPHIVQAHRTAGMLTRLRQDLRHGAEGSETGDGVVRITHTGHVVSATPRAQAMLEASYGERAKVDGRLPDELDAWIKQEVNPQTGNDAAPAARPVTVHEHRSRGQVVRCFVHAKHIVLVLSMRPAAASPVCLERLGLTRREAEVMSLVLLEHTNQSIAARLAIDRRTVEKHLERVYKKLGVTTRTAAAAWARQALGVVRLAGA